MRHTLGSYRRLLGAQLRSQLQYRISFVLDLLATMLVTLTEFGAVALVFERFDNIQGWTLGEVAFLYGLVELSFGLMDMIFAGFDPARFGQEARKGTFDRLLLRPVPVTWQVLGSDITLRRIGRIALGVGIFALTLHSPVWTVAKLLYLPLVVLGMVLFFGGLFIIGSTATFWTVESFEAMNILTYGGSYLISYPMSIYQEWLRRIFTFVVPAIFLNYYPALYFLDKADPFGFPVFAPFLAPLAGGAVFGQRTTLWWDLPVIESLELLRYIYQVPEQTFKDNLREFEQVLELGEFLNAPVRTRSLGQRMRADLCAALLHNPDLLFLDEPTIGLDVVAKERIRRFIQHVNETRATTVLLTTHDLADVQKLCTRVLIIDHGKLLYDGSLARLQTRFGGKWRLSVDFAEAYRDVSVEGAELLHFDKLRAVYAFDRGTMSASDLIGRLSLRFSLRDISVHEPDAETTIRRIYEEKLLVRSTSA